MGLAVSFCVSNLDGVYCYDRGVVGEERECGGEDVFEEMGRSQTQGDWQTDFYLICCMLSFLCLVWMRVYCICFGLEILGEGHSFKNEEHCDRVILF
jgi:hypothetical protein